MQGQGALRLDTWLSKLLWAVATKQGGVLRVDAIDLEDAPDRVSIVTDYDKEKHEVVITAHSGASSFIVVNTENKREHTQWENSQPPSPPSSETSRSASSRGPLDDSQLAEIENRLLRRAQQRQEEQRRQEETQALKDL